MHNISFKSKIKPLSPNEFKEALKKFRTEQFVNYPWTVNESVFSEQACTTGIIDCTSCIITDKKNVLLLHLCPNNSANSNFSKIAEFIDNTLKNFSSKINAILVGSKSESFMLGDSRSTDLFNNLAKFLEERSIPSSKFQGGKHLSNIAFDCKKDEMLLSVEDFEYGNIIDLTKENLLNNKVFEIVELRTLDEIV